jgi:hypothetical protein
MLPAGDHPGHVFSINQSKCTATKGAETAGVEQREGVATEVQETKGMEVRERGRDPAADAVHKRGRRGLSVLLLPGRRTETWPQ